MGHSASDQGSRGKGSRGEKSKDSKREQDRRASVRAFGRMTKEDASRIQSAADKEGKNQDFKSRAMSAASKNEEDED